MKGRIPVLFAVAAASLCAETAASPPTCHRTRPKDAKAGPHRPGLETPFLAFPSGEGGFEAPVPPPG